MKSKVFLFFLIATTICRPLSAKETISDCCGEGACCGTRGATVLSMMGWGVGLAVGIALLCGLLEQETAHAHN